MFSKHLFVSIVLLWLVGCQVPSGDGQNGSESSSSGQSRSSTSTSARSSAQSSATSSNATSHSGGSESSSQSSIDWAFRDRYRVINDSTQELRVIEGSFSSSLNEAWALPGDTHEFSGRLNFQFGAPPENVNEEVMLSLATPMTPEHFSLTLRAGDFVVALGFLEDVIAERTWAYADVYHDFHVTDKNLQPYVDLLDQLVFPADDAQYVDIHLRELYRLSVDSRMRLKVTDEYQQEIQQAGEPGYFHKSTRILDVEEVQQLADWSDVGPFEDLSEPLHSLSSATPPEGFSVAVFVDGQWSNLGPLSEVAQTRVQPWRRLILKLEDDQLFLDFEHTVQLTDNMRE